MSSGLIVAIGVVVLCYLFSGARTHAYLLYFLAFIPFVSFDPSSGGLQDVSGLGGQNVLIKMGVRAATTAGFMVLLLRRKEVLGTLLAPACLPVVAYFVWAMLGIYRAQSEWVSFFRLGELLAFFIIGTVLYLESGRFRTPRELVRFHCMALLPLCIITLYFAEIEPTMAYHVGPGGLKRLGHHFIEANILGFAACTGLLWATHELKEPRENKRSFLMERILPFAGLWLSTHVLIYARSRTAMITAIVGMLILWFPYYGSSKTRRAAFGAMMCAALALTVVNLDVVTAWFLRGDSAEDLATGTGRTGLWDALVGEQVPRSPMIGAGYLMLGPGGGFDHAGRVWSNAHNTYMFSLVSTGIPGLLMVLWISLHPVYCLIRRVHSGPKEERASWAVFLAMTLVVGVTNITGFGISGFPNAAMLFHYAIYPLAVLPRKSDYKEPLKPDRTISFPTPEMAMPRSKTGVSS